MKYLWVLRHAKAEGGGPGTDDHSRRLTARGRHQARQVASQGMDLALSGATAPEPELVLTSTAARALETAGLAVASLGRVELREEPSLYTASPDDVVDLLRTLDDELASVMVVGHNPTLEDLVFWLVEPGQGFTDSEASRAFNGLRTGDLVVLCLEIESWSRLAPGEAKLLSNFSPHEN